MEGDFEKEDQDHYEYTMTILKEAEFVKLGSDRHNLEVDLNKELIGRKGEEIAQFKDERQKVAADFLALAEYQESLKKEQELRTLIEESNVNLQLLNIQVKELEDATEYYNERKDELIEEKKTSEVKNEELKKELATKEEIAAKRL
mmetsp:Transcript_30110/g.22368  ORF Transcript_30110/g.22368 Transcript_30110/m.22368 type:complete len:146 (-) Transcript_30110:581-1018(-)